jgi:SIR2-like protein
MADFDEIVKAVKANECILFLGAGVHYPPEDSDPVYGGCYPMSDRPPLGAELAEMLADDIKLDEDAEYSKEAKLEIVGDLKRVSLYYEVATSRTAMVNKVRTLVSDNKQPSRALSALAELDFPLICTTNYDKLFEKALIVKGKGPIVSSYSNNRFAITKDYTDAKLDPRKPFLFKIHGDIDDPTDSIVITDEDYIEFILRNIWGMGAYDPIPSVFSYHLRFWPVLFVGFSLMDYNLRLIFKIMGWELPKPKESYSIGPYPDGLIRKKYDPPVKFVVQDVWSFVPALYKAVTGKDMP